MTYTIADMRTFLNLTIAQMSDATLTECLTMATDRVNGICAAYGVGTGGTSYDVAVKWNCCIHIWRSLDIQNIRPDAIAMGSLHINTNNEAAIRQFEEYFMHAVETMIIQNYPIKRDAYIKRLRGGRGAR